MSECLFRKTECKSKTQVTEEMIRDNFNRFTVICQLCLIGQLCDETSLNTRAFMDASINKMEAVYKEEYE